VTTTPLAPKPFVRKATLFSFVFVLYSYTTGGPFGFEDMITTSGPGMTLLYHLLIPFFWCIPISLVAAELTTAMPVQGGFYRWVRAAFGDFWGFLAGWWNWSASFLLGSVYAVLFADYLGFYFPQLTGRNHYLVAAALIVVITYINVRGIQMVGRISTLLEIFVLLPVVVMVVMGLVMAGNSTKAQGKIGYISLSELIPAMPEYKKADTALNDYQSALGENVEDMKTAYYEQDSLLSSKDTAKYTRAQLELKKKNMGEMLVKLQGWQQQAQQLYQQKQQDLITPIQKKAVETVQAVAKENGYTYVLTKEALLASPPADDLLPLVKKKLGLK